MNDIVQFAGTGTERPPTIFATLELMSDGLGDEFDDILSDIDAVGSFSRRSPEQRDAALLHAVGDMVKMLESLQHDLERSRIRGSGEGAVFIALHLCAVRTSLLVQGGVKEEEYLN